MKIPMMSWSDRFALIEAYQPDDQTICKTFNLSQGELQIAKSLKQSGTFMPNKAFDIHKYQNIFSNEVSVFTDVTPAHKLGNATSHTLNPQSATKRTAIPKEPQKRGRKGDKISQALLVVPTIPEPVEEFALKNNVSVAVLRQAKRFLDTMDKEVADKIGKVIVKQNKLTKTLMIWREDI